MNFINAVARYFRGDNKDYVVKRFTELTACIDSNRAKIDEMAKGLTAVVSDVDEIKKAANVVLASEDLTDDNVSVVLDNIKFSNASLSNYMSKFKSDLESVNKDLMKAESELVSLIESNPMIAHIIVDIKHDERLKKSLDVIVAGYK